MIEGISLSTNQLLMLSFSSTDGSNAMAFGAMRMPLNQCHVRCREMSYDDRREA
jgi:hypothetical protein